MKIATILYHKNILKIYKEEWIKKCVDSIKDQSINDFVIYELNYGDDDLNLNTVYDFKQKHNFYHIEMNNHADAMNFLLSKCLEDGFDVVFNNNMDDYSDDRRFEIQLSKINEGYDIVSSNFKFVDEVGNFGNHMTLSHLDIKEEFSKDHNLICHPSVCYSRNFLLKNKYNGDEIPEEDFKLWKRSINDFKFFVCPEILVYYRFHKNQITSISRYKDKENEFIKENQRLMSDLSGQYSESKINDIINSRINGEFPKEPITIRRRGNIVGDVCYCGEMINRINYNFCQKCNKLYD